jgi:hypothetical protein
VIRNCFPQINGLIRTFQIVWAHNKGGEGKHRRMAKQERTQRRRLRGRTRHTWEDEIQKIMKERGIEWDGVAATARDRERWRAVCEPPAAPSGTGGSTV